MTIRRVNGEIDLLPDLTNLSVDHLLSAGLGVIIWGYFVFFCVARSRAAGLEYEEPVVWLYGSLFKILRWISFPLLACIGLLNVPQGDFISLAIKGAQTLVFSVGCGALVACSLFAVVDFYWILRERQAMVVYEGFPGVRVAGLALLFASPFIVMLAGPPLLDMFFGAAADDVIAQFHLGSFILTSVTLCVLWVGPVWADRKLDLADENTAWANSPGQALYRWSALGFIMMAALGIFSTVAGLDLFLTAPIEPAVGAGLAGAIVAGYVLFLVLPIRAIARRVAEDDFLANEVAIRVRFSGILAYLDYRRSTSHRKKRASGEAERQLCPTCLRPIDELDAYETKMKFDECPYCASFIPAVFTYLDFVKHQATVLLPLLGEDSDGKKKKIRRRTGDEIELVQDIIKALIGMAVFERGTDLHLIIEHGKFVIKCRTDGFLYSMIEFDPLMARPIISAVKVKSNLDITERRKPQDGKFTIDLIDTSIDIRVNTSPVGDGEMAALRLLYRQDVLGSLEGLGMLCEKQELMKRLIHQPNGLILVAGPTGSGKSTTLYNALEILATGVRNIITLEDPIEYEIEGLTQMQVNEKKGFTFASGLRTILRQDPDVIMVGEIRDSETARMAIDASATGHLVFSTLHATDSIGAVGRLSDLDIDIRRLGTTLQLSLAQRLIRMICRGCSAEYTISRGELADMGYPGFPDVGTVLQRGMGCPRCHETGFYGREGIYEFFVPNRAVREKMTEGWNETQIRDEARSQGMRTMLEDGMAKAILGHTTIDEIIRVTS